MAKIPVTKTVVRNGQSHVQTYWEEDDKRASGSPRLAGIGVSLPPQPKTITFPVDPELEMEWQIKSSEDDSFSPEDVQAAIAAGLTFNAAKSIVYTMEPSSLSDYIYENNLEEMPRPKGGWKNRDGYPSSDQRRSWENEEVPLDTAVEWINAGFESPGDGLAQMIKMGASLERAKQWNDHLMSNPLRGRYSSVMQSRTEIMSDISFEDAMTYREAIYGDTNHALTHRDLDYYEHGIPAPHAARWIKATFDDVRIEQVVALREMKWSPTAVKGVLKGFAPKQKKFGIDIAKMLIDATPKVGNSKVVADWSETARVIMYNSGVKHGPYDAFTDSTIAKIHELEQFKERAAKETGVPITSDDYYDLAALKPSSRETFIGLMKAESRIDQDVRSTLRLAKYIGSESNFNLLKDKGFVFEDPDTGAPFNLTYGTDSDELFDAASADQSSQSTWMKNVALRLYCNNTRLTSNPKRWVEDDSIDPIQLKDALIADPNIDELRLEGLLVGGVSNAVSSGWL